MDDGFSYFMVVLILAGVGLLILRLTPRTAPLEERVKRWAVGLGIFSGAAFAIHELGNARRADDLLSTLFSAGFFGLCAAFLWFFVLAVLTFVYQAIVAPPFRLLGSWRRRLADRRARRADERRRRREQREHERMAPFQEQAKRDEEYRKADAQNRRADARANCEYLFNLYAPEIASRFSRQDLDAWIKKHMADDQDPSLVEQRAEQLRRLIEHHRDQTKPAPKFSNIQELARWFQHQKAEIESLPVDDRTKRVLTARLNQRNAELMTELVASMQPGERTGAE